MNLLIVEDDKGLIKQWEEKLKFYHVDDPIYSIIPTYVDNLSDAEGLLENTFFDAAVIDIRLKNSGGGDNRNKDGNAIYKQLTETSLSITAVYTAEPEIVIQEEYMREYSRVFEKGEGKIEEILAWLDEKKEMIASISKMKRDIDIQMAKVFSKSIWPRWNYWKCMESTDDQYIDNALTRHMSTHLHASFLNDVEAVHPEEHYFIPSLTTELDTGDITFAGGKHYILITPRCEIAQNKNKTFQFIELKDISKDITKHENKIEILDAIKDLVSIDEFKGTKAYEIYADLRELDQLEKLKREVTMKIDREKNKRDALFRHGGNKASLHFLPVVKQEALDDLGPFHVQFDRLITIDKANNTELLPFKNGVYASLSNEFVPSLIERLGGYFSRIGTPDYSHPE